MASNHYRASDALNIISCMTMGLIESGPAPLSEREKEIGGPVHPEAVDTGAHGYGTVSGF